MQTLRTIGVALLAVSCSHAAVAGDFDGSKLLLCATSLAIECQQNYECETTAHSEVAFPRFVEVDAKKKVVSAANSSGASSPIGSVSHDGGNLILQGVEEGRGWTLLIDESTGEMSVSVADPDGAFVLFGACTSR